MIKKLAKIVGFLAGAAALAWAMRDRLISVATSREPEPPTFRTTAPTSARSGIDVIAGIGPVFAVRLRGAGIDTAAKLAAASPDRVAEAAGVSAARARSWIEQAQSIS
ncbi:MAG: helix-hairpin-helix domain-containing protein [Actinomycetota bacterium]|nr:helix-hairpin-helix domain-containing protein [Actinomycetota bacterium]